MTEQEKAEQLKKQVFYDPFPDCPSEGCSECYNENCAERTWRQDQEEDMCDFNGDECLEPFLHHHCGCVGCEVITPQTDEDAKLIHEWAEKENAVQDTSKEVQEAKQ